MKSSTLHLILLFSLAVFGRLEAQLYTVANDLLPASGAVGQSVDVQAVDIDQDGDWDIVLANEYQFNTILFNDGQGNFSAPGDAPLPQVVHDSEDIAIADFNLDGLLDLVFVSEDDFQHEYYWNIGNASFTHAQFLPFTACNAVAAGDLNGDSKPDLFLGNQGQNMVLINNGLGELLNQTPDRLPNGFDFTHDVKLVDVNGDQALDVYIGNENGDVLMINNGGGFFSDESAFRLPFAPQVDTRKVIFGDVDADGDQDAFLCTVEFALGKDPQNRLYLNDGNGYFTDVTDSHLPIIRDQSLDAIFIDLELDNDLDLLITGVLNQPVKFYLNNGQGVFSDASFSVMGTNDFMVDSLDALGVINRDFNGDNFEDLYICNRAGQDVFLLRDPVGDFFSPVSTKEAYSSTPIQIFPNPNRGQFRVALPQSNHQKIEQISLYDWQGRHLQTVDWEPISATGIAIDILSSDLAAGLYLLQIQDEKGLYLQKFNLMN